MPFPSGGGGGIRGGAGADPLPDAAAKRFASWRNLQSTVGGDVAPAADGAGVHPRGVGNMVGNGEDTHGGGRNPWGRGETGGDVLNREAFEALLPCIFHADDVHDEVRGELDATTSTTLGCVVSST